MRSSMSDRAVGCVLGPLATLVAGSVPRVAPAARGRSRMRAWDESDDVDPPGAERRDADHDETLPRAGRRGRRARSRPARPPSPRRRRPRERPRPPARPRGARRAAGRSGSSAPGPVGTALGIALDRAGWPVAAVASRDPAAVNSSGSWSPGARVRRGERPGRRRRARVPDRPRRRHRPAWPSAPAVRRARRWSTPSGSWMPRPSTRRWPPAPRRRVPPAGRLRRPRPGAGGPARRDRSRSRATTSWPRILADLAEAIGGMPVRLPRARSPPTTPRRSSRPVARRPARRHPRVAAAARPRRGGRAARSTCRCLSRPWPTPGRWASAPPSPGRPCAATSGTIDAPPRGPRADAPGCPADVRGAARTDAAIAERRAP